MKKNDWLIIVSGIVLAAALFLVFTLKDHTGPLEVSIQVDGSEVTRLELKKDSYEYLAETPYGKNRLRVDADGVQVVESNCSSQTCVHFGKITAPGQIIACLPHHLTITLEGESDETNDFDAISN